MDQGFHRLFHLGPRRRRDLAIVDRNRAFGHLRDGLADDRETLAHFLDAHEIAVEAIAVLADRDIEIHFGIGVVGLGLAQIPGDVRAAQHRPAHAPVHRLFRGHDPDIDRALLEDAVAGQQNFDIVDDLRKGIGPGQNIVGQPAGQILMHTARPEIGRMQARAADPLIEFHQIFAMLEHPQEGRHRADIQGEGADVQDVIQDPRDLGIEDADILRARRRFDPEQMLDRQGVGVLLAHRRDVIEPVEIRQRLQVGLVFDQLLGAAMQQTDMRVRAIHRLAVEFEDEAQHAMGRWMLGAEIDRVVLDLDFRGSHDASSSAVAFSSPGSSRVMPSHGLMKSKVRKSWTSLTGS